MSEERGRKRLGVEEAKRLRVNLVRVAGLAAALGVLMEVILVVGGQATASISDLLNNGLWPFLVCMAVAVGQAVVGGWPARAATFSVIATPAAFIGAKIIQKGISVMLDNTAAGNVVTGDLLLEAGLRALEYAVLAALFAWLVWQPWAGALAHVGMGAAIGIVFGALIAVFITPDSPLGFVVEEIVFPSGCALIIFASETLARLLPEDVAPSPPA